MMLKDNEKLSYMLIAIFLLITIVVGRGYITTQAQGKNEAVNVFLNDEQINFKNASPVNKDGITYVSIKEFSDKIGAEVKFYKLDNRVVISKNDKNLAINTNDNLAITDDNKSFFVETIGKSAKMLAPVDTIAKYFDYEVSEIQDKSFIRVKNNECKLTDDELAKKLDKEINSSKENIANDNNNTNNSNVVNATENKGTKVAYITFDDGPNAITPNILDVLKEKNVKATFFMLGSSINKHKDIAKRIKDEGHTLGIHSMTHNRKVVYASPWSFLYEMNAANDMLYEATEDKTLVIRAPYGSKPYMKQEFRDLAIAWGYRIWDWNVDSRDSIKKKTTPDEVYNNVVYQLQNKEYAIILFHDRQHTVEALPKIIDYLKENKFNIETINSKMTPVNFWNDIR